MYSKEIEDWCRTNTPAHKSRERTLQILTYVLNKLVSEGNCVCISLYLNISESCLIFRLQIDDICENDGPEVSIVAYLTRYSTPSSSKSLPTSHLRFFKYTPCKKDIFISTLVYLDRQINNCGLVVSSTNVHRQYLIWYVSLFYFYGSNSRTAISWQQNCLKRVLKTFL